MLVKIERKERRKCGYGLVLFQSYNFNTAKTLSTKLKCTSLMRSDSVTFGQILSDSVNCMTLLLAFDETTLVAEPVPPGLATSGKLIRIRVSDSYITDCTSEALRRRSAECAQHANVDFMAIY